MPEFEEIVVHLPDGYQAYARVWIGAEGTMGRGDGRHGSPHLLLPRGDEQAAGHSDEAAKRRRDEAIEGTISAAPGGERAFRTPSASERSIRTPGAGEGAFPASTSEQRFPTSTTERPRTASTSERPSSVPPSQGGTQRGLVHAVLYHHGIQSHCGWYEGSARALAQAGFTVLQVDRRGSGRNLANRGHAESAEQLIEDAFTAGQELKRRTGFDRYHVIGVSWGGKLAVAAHVVHPEEAASLTLVTPGLFPKVGVSKTEMARIGLAMIYEPRKLFNIPLDDPELFTHDPKWQRFIATDELTLRQCTAGFYLASRRMDRVVARLAQARLVPIHLMLAGEERIVDNGKTEAYIRALARKGNRIQTFPTARHSLEFDDPDDYLPRLSDFMTSEMAP